MRKHNNDSTVIFIAGEGGMTFSQDFLFRTILLCAVAAGTVVVHEDLELPLLDGRALRLHDLAHFPCSPSAASARSLSDWHGSAGGSGGGMYDQVRSELIG